MNVTKLVDLVSQFSFSNTPTKKQREVYLRCLNLANIELYQRILDSNQFFKSKEIFQEVDKTFKITDEIFYLKKIFNKDKGLINHKLDTTVNILATGEFFREGNLLTIGDSTFSNKDDGTGSLRNYVKIIYIPYPKTLVESISDRDLETDIPVYAEPFHFTLAQGALYYLLLSTKGYSEKTSLQYMAYNKAIDNFDRFYNIGTN